MGLEDFLNETNEVIAIEEENAIATKILEIENQIANTKEQQKMLEQKVGSFKEQLMNLMISRGCMSWKTPNNFTFSVVEAKEPEEVIEKKFNEELFKKEQLEMYEKYLKEEKKMKNGRKGYLRITTQKKRG